MADFYARLTKEQEERENREARERFAASQRKNSVWFAEACLRSNPGVSARLLTQVAGLRKGSGNASTQSGALLRFAYELI